MIRRYMLELLETKKCLQVRQLFTVGGPLKFQNLEKFVPYVTSGYCPCYGKRKHIYSIIGTFLG